MHRRAFLRATVSSTVTVASVPSLARGRTTIPAAQSAQDGSFQPLGRVAVDGIKEVVVPDDEIAYAAVTDGVATIDVGDPEDPSVLADRRDLLDRREDGPLTAVWDAKVDGEQLVAVGPAHPGDVGLAAAVFYDVSDPAAPTRLGVHETDYPIHNCAFVDGVCYLTGNRPDRSELVAVAAGASPSELGTWSIADHDERWLDVSRGLWPLHDVFVQDDVAYLAHWDAGTWLVDVADPSDPSLLSRVRGRPAADLAALPEQDVRVEAIVPPGNDHYAAVDADGSLLGIGEESWALDTEAESGGPGGVELWDISTPTAPRRLATIEPPATPDPTYGGVWTTAHNFAFADGRLYAAWYRGGVRVFDVTDPAAPTELAAWRDADQASFWTAQTAGNAVVAPSVGYPDDVTEQALFTFPEPAGRPTESAT